MKLTSDTRDILLPEQAGKSIRALAKQKGLKAEDIGILLFVADMCDEIAKGTNMYAVIGSVKDRSAYSLTVKGDLGGTAVYASTFREFNLKVASICDDL